jgi:REP element-mobilizing transposase RayT
VGGTLPGMPPPLAYFISWTTKGSWPHGDPRGWVMDGNPGIQEPDPQRYEQARRQMNHDEVVLEPEHREIVIRTIEEHCAIRGWTLHVVNARSNHVHVVVTADGYDPETVMEQFKAWCSRRLNEYEAARTESCAHASLARRPGTSPTRQRGECPPAKRKWWTEHGSTKWINDAMYLHNATVYVRDKQGD